MRLSYGAAVAKKASARVVPRASKYHSRLRLLGWRGEVQGAGGSGSFFVGEVEVDHGGGDIGMTEDVLEGADVGVGIEEVRCKAVPEGVAGNSFGDGGFAKGLLSCRCMESSRR